MCANTPFAPGTPVRTTYDVDDRFGPVPAGTEGVVMDGLPLEVEGYRYIRVDVPELNVILYASRDLLEYA